MPATGEFRLIYLSDLGYVAYRHSFDETRCSVEEGARAHKYAVFVEEIEGRAWCDWKNANR
jgi:hypothetical protein